MSETKPPFGTVGWMDLTTTKADALKKFYSEVVGWTTEDLSMSDEEGDYADYVMMNEAGAPVAGVCHLRGVNTGIPAQWIIYIHVPDIAASIQKAIELNGNLIKEYRNKEGQLVYAMIQDVAGAVFALSQM